MAPKAKADAKAKPAAKAKGEAKKKPVKKPVPEEPEKPRVPQPDRAAHDEAVGKLSADIDAITRKVQDVNNQISKKQEGKSGDKTKRDEIVARRAVAQKEISGIVSERNALKGEKEKTIAENKEKRTELDKMKRSMTYTSEEAIDKRIADIEFKLWTDTIALKEEKDLMKEISQLKKDKPKVAQLFHKEGEVRSLGAGMNIGEQLKALGAQLQIAIAKKEEVQKELDEMGAGREGEKAEVDELYGKREKFNNERKDKITQRTALKDEFREEEKKYREVQNELRAERQKKYEAERNFRQAEYESREKEKKKDLAQQEPHIEERALVSQCIAYVKALMPKEAEEKKDEKKEVKGFEEKGLTMVTPKDDQEEFYFVPTKTKGIKGKKTTKKDGSGAIKHNMDNFVLFQKVKVDAPLKTDQLPDTLEKLIARMETLMVAVKKWEEKNTERERREKEGLAPLSDDEPEKEAKEEEKEEKKAEEEDEKEDEKEEEKEEAEEKKEEEES